MPKFQISFTRGTPIALALDKNNEQIFKIHVRAENGDEPPDIKVDNILELVQDEDIKKLKFSMKMGKIEEKLLVSILGKGKGCLPNCSFKPST